MKQKIELANPHEVETISNIVSEIRKDKKPYALKVAKELEDSSCGDRVLNEDAANCLKDDCAYIKQLADRIESCEHRMQRELCGLVAKLTRDSLLLEQSDTRNGTPYKLFGIPLTKTLGTLAADLYRIARIKRKFWLDYLKENDSDPKGTSKHLAKVLKKQEGELCHFL